MQLLQNSKQTHPTFLEESIFDQENYQGFLDLQDILYPDRKEFIQSSTSKTQENLTIQVAHQSPPLPQNHQNNLQSYKQTIQLQDNMTHSNNFQENQTKIQCKVSRSRQSNRHNFPKHLVRKIKDLMKKILNIKKKARLQEVTSLRTLFFYCFHQNLRKYENIQILHLFLQQQDQATSLEKEFKLEVEKYDMSDQISLQVVNKLREQLRKAIIQEQQYLFSLIEKGQIGRKQEFIQFIQKFLNDIRSGIVRSTHK